MRAGPGGTERKFFHAVILDATGDEECLVADLTAEGACIRLDRPDLRQDWFSLSFGGALPRSCEVVWRSRGEIGVRFHRSKLEGPIGDDRGEHFKFEIPQLV
jgi:hypothetical protein